MNWIPPDFGPVEDLMLGIFRRWFDGQDVTVLSEFEEHMSLPTVVVRADRRSGLAAFHSTSDDRFARASVVSISVFCNGPTGNGLNADKQASQLAESCTLAMRTAVSEQWVIPRAGHLSVIDNSTPFMRAQDWQTSTSVVQYASLPDGTVRYEAVYRILFRPPVEGSGNPFLPNL